MYNFFVFYTSFYNLFWLNLLVYYDKLNNYKSINISSLTEDSVNYNLTSGKIGKSLIIFSLPMILGNLIQQLYNITDTLIVGKGIGPVALSAVASSYALMVLLTSIVLGLCMGSSVVFSQLYGAEKYKVAK